MNTVKDVIVIDADVKERVSQAVAWARENIVPYEVLERNAVEAKSVIKLSDRPEGNVRAASPEPVSIPFGYNACYTIENQKDGLYGHLSVSVDLPGWLPSEVAMIEIAKLYGLPREKWVTVWCEEFAPGCEAVNILCPIELPATVDE